MKRKEKKNVCNSLCYWPAAICMYPARVQILLSHPPLGRKIVMMANRELTASNAQPPEHSTALVWGTHKYREHCSKCRKLSSWMWTHGEIYVNHKDLGFVAMFGTIPQSQKVCLFWSDCVKLGVKQGRASIYLYVIAICLACASLIS